jgi:plasmid maintenance system antidote protein VapI
MAFGTSPDLWMRLQAKYDLQMLENSPENQNIFKGIKKTAVGYHTLEVA